MGPEAPKDLQGAPGGDFDSFWCASRTSRGPKKGVRKMDRKMDPRKIDFRRVLDRDRANPGGVCGSHLALEFEDIESSLARRAPQGGGGLKTPCGAHTAAPVILARLSLWGLGGLCVACPCGRSVICQGLDRTWLEFRGRYGTGSHRLPVRIFD